MRNRRIFAKEDDALDEKLRNWHWREGEERPPKKLGVSMFAGQLTVLAALSEMLTYWKESEVKTGTGDEAGKVSHVPETGIV